MSFNVYSWFCGYLLWFQRVEYRETASIGLPYPSGSFDASCDQFRRLSLFFPIPFWMSIFIFIRPIRFWPFLEEFPLCLEYGALHYFAFVLYYECSWENLTEEEGCGFEGDTELNNYKVLSEKIARIERDCSGDSRYLWDTRQDLGRFRCCWGLD